MSQNIIHANYNNLNTYGTFEKLMATREFYTDKKDEKEEKKTNWLYFILFFVLIAIVAFYFFFRGSRRSMNFY